MLLFSFLDVTVPHAIYTMYAMQTYILPGDWEPEELVERKSKMASSLVKQELPPKGGYPAIEYTRNLPKRGPSGLMIFVGGAAVMAFGFYHVIKGNRRRW